MVHFSKVPNILLTLLLVNLSPKPVVLMPFPRENLVKKKEKEQNSITLKYAKVELIRNVQEFYN